MVGFDFTIWKGLLESEVPSHSGSLVPPLQRLYPSRASYVALETSSTHRCTTGLFYKYSLLQNPTYISLSVERHLEPLETNYKTQVLQMSL